ncbi:MAG: uracil phosphoribosyltransferase [bacterium]
MNLKSILFVIVCLSLSTAYGAKESTQKNVMNDVLVTQLRDKQTDIQEFRRATECLGYVLAVEAANHMATKAITIQTLLAPANGITFEKNVVIVPVLRAGMSMADPFLKFFPRATIAVVGLKRNEETAAAYWYYENVPTINPTDQVIILDPMFATGGTVSQVIGCLLEKGATEENVMYVGVISAPQAIKRISREYPAVKIILAAQDPILNEKSYIVPGLGDYGDFYCGTK